MLALVQPEANVAVAVYVMFAAIPEADTLKPEVVERYVAGLQATEYKGTPPTIVIV